jgi:uncharacterized protein
VWGACLHRRIVPLLTLLHATAYQPLSLQPARSIHTKRRGQPPDLKEPVVLTHGRHGITVEALCDQIHRDMKKVFKYALVWGTSTRHSPQHCGLAHVLHDEDIVQIVTQSVAEQKQSKDYAKRVQEHYDRYKEKKKKAGGGGKGNKLKT